MIIDEIINRHLGKTLMYLAINNELAGILILEDKIKDNTKNIILEINRLKPNLRMIILTGDNEYTAMAIASQVGISDFHANMSPQNKFEFIKDLQAQGYYVAMAGDGINDAPSISQANVGIAMGNGTDIAIQSASIILVKGNLKNLLTAFKLSQKTLINIKQNLFLAFAYNGLAVPIAAGLFYPIFHIQLNPVIASLAMSLSSVSVIYNALRLKKALND